MNSGCKCVLPCNTWPTTPPFAETLLAKDPQATRHMSAMNRGVGTARGRLDLTSYYLIPPTPPRPAAARPNRRTHASDTPWQRLRVDGLFAGTPICLHSTCWPALGWVILRMWPGTLPRAAQMPYSLACVKGRHLLLAKVHMTSRSQHYVQIHDANITNGARTCARAE